MIEPDVVTMIGVRVQAMFETVMYCDKLEGDTGCLFLFVFSVA